MKTESNSARGDRLTSGGVLRRRSACTARHSSFTRVNTRWTLACRRPVARLPLGHDDVAAAELIEVAVGESGAGVAGAARRGSWSVSAESAAARLLTAPTGTDRH